MELCFYNAVLTGMSEDGKRFTYVNQLASSDTDLSKRAEWFTCACCPPVRSIPPFFGKATNSVSDYRTLQDFSDILEVICGPLSTKLVKERWTSMFICTHLRL